MALARLRPHLLAECFMVFVVLLLLLFGFRCEPLHSSQQQGKEAGSSFNGQLDDINNSTLGVCLCKTAKGRNDLKTRLMQNLLPYSSERSMPSACRPEQIAEMQ